MRWFFLVVLSALICAPALAQEPYPSKPIRFIVPFAAGGTADLAARVVADQLQLRFGRSVVVENRPGAGGAIGAEQTARAAPDGYTIGLGSVSSHATNFLLQANLRYDPRTDFTPIGLIAGVPNVMAISASLPIKTVQEFIAYAKARPGELNFGSIGNGTSQHLGGELFKMRTGVDMVHIPYSTNALLLSDLANGKVHVVFDNLANVLGQVQGGRLRALALTTDKRWPDLPDVGTLMESGIPDYNISSWVALYGPAGLPQPIAEKLSAELTAILATPEVQKRLLQAGTLPLGGDPAALVQHMDAELARWTVVIAAAGMKKQ